MLISQFSRDNEVFHTEANGCLQDTEYGCGEYSVGIGFYSRISLFRTNAPPLPRPPYTTIHVHPHETCIPRARLQVGSAAGPSPLLVRRGILRELAPRAI